MGGQTLITLRFFTVNVYQGFLFQLIEITSSVLIFIKNDDLAIFSLHRKWINYTVRTRKQWNSSYFIIQLKGLCNLQLNNFL